MSVGARVALLLPRMTLAQKVDILGLANVAGYENETTAVPALCIPAFTLNDGPAGIIAGPPGSHTQLPAPIGVGASFDVALAKQYGAVMGGEAAAKGIDVVQAPDLNIARVPQSGRNFETFGEDPYLTSQLGLATALGIESQGVGSMPKHFAVYNQETYRNTTLDDAILSLRVLHEIYLFAWRTVVTQGHPSAIMCSYAEVNGPFSCEDPYLLTQVLEDRWGFTGFIRTDEGASHNTLAAVLAGTDQFKPAVGAQIVQDVNNGQISTVQINDAVSRVLREMFALGVFNRSGTGNANTNASTPSDVAFARTAAEKSMVLLKDSGGILPLSGVRSIAVIGADGGVDALTATPPPSADHVSSSSVVTPYQGIAAMAGPGVTVTYAQGVPTLGTSASASEVASLRAAAASQAAAAQVAIVFAAVSEHEGADLPNLSLPDSQDSLIQAVAQANPHTIVVLNTATPVLMPWLGQVPAVLEAWYPGQQDGNAVAAVLFGEVNPSGKLPMTFPASQSQTPVSTPAQFPGVGGKVTYSEGLDVGYRWYDAHGVTPLFPFGFGLSYTTFAFSGLTVSPGSTTSLGTVDVTATVTNTGQRVGTEVAQLYVGDPAAVGEPPLQLKGFQRVTLSPGQSAQVHFTLPPQALSYWNSTSQSWVVADGTYRILVGDSSAQLPLQGTVQVTASTGERVLQISAPSKAEAGVPFTVKAILTAGGNLPLQAAQFHLAAPAGWTVQALGPTDVSGVSSTQVAQTVWQVTAPDTAAATSSLLGATALLQGSGGTADETAYAQVAVDQPVTMTAPSAVVLEGGSGQLVVRFNDTGGANADVTWTAAVSGQASATVVPSTGSLRVESGSGGTSQLSIAGASAPGILTIDANAQVGSSTVALPALNVPLTVASPSLAAAFNNVGITAAADRQAGNIPGTGTSFSASALAGMGLTPGATVTHDGITFTWPGAAPGQPDNVVAEGQTIAVSGTGSELGFLGCSDFGPSSGQGTIVYTDGTTQAFTLTMTDWFYSQPASGDQVLGIMQYRNSQTGRSAHIAVLYYMAVPLQAGKTVAYVTLPDIGPAVDNQTAMHIFAMAIGG
jgi:beta-glucosidase